MNNVESMTEFSKQVFEATLQVVESMNDGDHMQLKQLTAVVALAVAKDPKEVLGFVNHFVRHTNVAYVARGKNGGLVKGVKSVKVVKPGKDKSAV